MPELDLFESRFVDAYRRYLDEAPTAVDAAAVARSVAAVHQWTRMRLAWPWVSRPIPALVWLLLIAALLAALGGTVLVASRLLEALPVPPRLDVRLAPTGIDMLTPDAGAYRRVVADGNGILWGLEPEGRLVRFDPASGSGQTWSVSGNAASAADAAFAASDIAPANAGGVWLVTGRTLRWFDGAAFRQVIEAPQELQLVTEAPDATLWAATADKRIIHWNGSTWTTLAPLPAGINSTDPITSIGAIAVDAAGRPWVGWYQFWGLNGEVSRLDGSTWTTFGETDATPLGGVVSGIVHRPGGVVWVATSRGLARFDGTSWTDQTPPSAGNWSGRSLAVGIDGAIWVAGAQDGGAITVREFDGRSWVSYGQADGLPVLANTPAPADNPHAVVVAPTKQGVFVGTSAGIYRLSNGRWEPAWPPASSPSNLTILLAVSHDELWARGEGGLWHLQAGAWSNDPIDPSRPTSAPVAMALAPDGTVWAAGDAGVAYHRDGRWTIADSSAASAIAVDRGGTVWVAGNGNNAGIPVWTLRFDGTVRAKQVLEPCPITRGSEVSLAIDGTGALWVGARSTVVDGGVARFDGRSWKTIGQLGGPAADDATVLGTGADGATWIITDSPVPLALRFDGMAWTYVEVPYDHYANDGLRAADGTLWVPTSRGPATYDGQRWTFPYEDDFPRTNTLTASYAIAPDGTVFGQTAAGIVRFPAPAPQP